MRRKLLISGGAAGLLLAIWFGYAGVEKFGTPSAPGERSLSALPLDVKLHQDGAKVTGEIVEAAKAKSVVAPRMDRLASNLLNSRNPYALAHELRARRTPGSLWMAKWLRMQCQLGLTLGVADFHRIRARAMTGAPQHDTDVFMVPSGTQDWRLREAAAQELKTLCTDLASSEEIAWPLTGDVFGDRLVGLAKQISQGDKSTQNEYIKEAASQGVLLAVLASFDIQASFFHGVLNAGVKPEVYKEAMFAAAQTVASERENYGSSISGRHHCMMLGLCEKVRDEAYIGRYARAIGLSEVEVRQFVKLHAELVEALEANKAKPFLVPTS